MTRHGNRIIRKVYVTEDEDRYFKILQEKCHIRSFSSFARRAMLYFGNYGNYFVIEACNRHCELMEERSKELSAIGNNFNQIAHQVNTFALQGKVQEKYFTDTIVFFFFFVFQFFVFVAQVFDCFPLLFDFFVLVVDLDFLAGDFLVLVFDLVAQFFVVFF